MKHKTCPECKKTIAVNGYPTHVNSKQCKKNQENKIVTKINPNWLQNNGKYKCPHCGKEYSKNGIGTHMWRNHGEGKDFTNNNAGYREGTREGYFKGKTKETCEILRKRIKTYQKNAKAGLHTPKPKPTKEQRTKISESMKKAHKEGRAWNIGMSRWNNEPSYPEKFFAKVIQNEFLDKNYTLEHPVGVYSIDFAWVDKKLAIEIDGEQHEKPDYKSRDIRKDKLLISEGWGVLRIKWKDMYNNPQKYIKIAIDFVH